MIKYKYKDWILLVCFSWRDECVNFEKRFAHYEIYTWTLCHSYLHEKQTSRIQSLIADLDRQLSDDAESESCNLEPIYKWQCASDRQNSSSDMTYDKDTSIVDPGCSVNCHWTPLSEGDTCGLFTVNGIHFALLNLCGRLMFWYKLINTVLGYIKLFSRISKFRSWHTRNASLQSDVLNFVKKISVCKYIDVKITANIFLFIANPENE